MSAMPAILTELMRQNETSRGANSGLLHRIKVLVKDLEAPLITLLAVIRRIGWLYYRS
jgi:hypothetical protein